MFNSEYNRMMRDYFHRANLDRMRGKVEDNTPDPSTILPTGTSPECPPTYTYSPELTPEEILALQNEGLLLITSSPTPPSAPTTTTTTLTTTTTPTTGSRSAGSDSPSGTTTKTVTNKYGNTVVQTYQDGKLVKEVEKDSMGDPHTITEYKYNSAGKVTEVTIKNGSGRVEGREFYTYNSQGQLVKYQKFRDYSSTFKDGEATLMENKTYTYYANNKLHQVVTEKFGGSSVIETYGSNGKIAEEIHKNSNDEVTEIWLYTYDDRGNVVKSERKDANGKTNWSKIFTYDENDKIVDTKVYDKNFWKKMNDIPLISDVTMYLVQNSFINTEYFNDPKILEQIFGRWITVEATIESTEEGFIIYINGKKQAEIINDDNSMIFLCIDEAGNHSEFVYDKTDGHQIYGLRQKGDSTVFYNNGNVLCVISDSKDCNICPNYDKNGKLKEIIVEGKNKRAIYGSNGRVRQIEDLKERSITYYDENGRKTEKYFDSYGVRTYYDEKGDVTGVVSDTGNIEDVYQKFIDEIYKKNSLGLPATADNLEYLITNFLYKGNIQEFLDYYKKNNPDGEDFLTALSEEFGLGSDLIKKLTEHINKLVEKSKEIKETIIKVDPPDNDTKPGEDVGSGDGGDNESPTIDGGELPEVTVTGDNPDDVTIYGSYHCKPFTNSDGETYYRIYSTKTGSYTYMSAKDYNKYLKGKSDSEAEKLIEKHSKDTLDELGIEPASTDNSHGTTTDDGKDDGNSYGDGTTTSGGNGDDTQSDDNAGFEWTEEQKQVALDNLKLTFGFDYVYVVAYNADGTVSFTAYDKSGNKVVEKDHFDYSENVDDEIEVFEWTDELKQIAFDNLRLTFGLDYKYVISYNADGTVSFTAYDKSGSKVVEKDHFDYSENVDDEIEVFEWSEEQKQIALDNLRLTFGFDYVYVVAYNADGTVSFTAYDKSGNKVVDKDHFDYSENVEEDDLGLHEWTEQEKDNVLLGLKKTYGLDNKYSIVFNTDGTFTFAIFDANGNMITPEEALAAMEAAAEAQLQAGIDWVSKNFTDANGNFNAEAFVEWINEKLGKNSAYLYKCDSLEDAYRALLNAYSTGNWDTFWTGVDNYGRNHHYSGSFDVYSFGGGGSSGNSSFDVFCNAMLAAWREMVEEGLDGHKKPKDVRPQHFTESNIGGTVK